MRWPGKSVIPTGRSQLKTYPEFNIGTPEHWECSPEQVEKLSLFWIHLKKKPQVFWIIGIAEGHFVYCLCKLSGPFGAYWHILFDKEPFEFFVDRVSNESHKLSDGGEAIGAWDKERLSASWQAVILMNIKAVPKYTMQRPISLGPGEGWYRQRMKTTNESDCFAKVVVTACWYRLTSNTGSPRWRRVTDFNCGNSDFCGGIRR